MTMKRRLVVGTTSAAALVALGIGNVARHTIGARLARAALAVDAPKFVVDPLWPKPMPNHWILGSAVGVAVDAHDHVFVVNLPNSFNARTEIGASTTPPTGDCCLPAPPVLEFDADGNLVGHWGGPGQGYDWPASPSGIAVDSKGNVWIGSGGVADAQVLEFTHDGKFIMQIGKPAGAMASAGPGAGGGARGDSSYAGVAPPTAGRGAAGRGGGGGVQGPVSQPAGHSTSPDAFGAPAHVAFDETAGEVYVADGYRNRRVAVIDMKSGAFKRFWGAYGGKPDDADLGPYTPGAPPARQFRAPVCAEPAKDGTVYVCDRQNDRLQLFHRDGSFIKEVTLAPKTLGEGSVWDVAFSRDPQQKYLYVADGQNMRVYVLDRKSLDVLTTFGDGGRYPGQFLAVHSLATDSKGNLYTAETYEGKRVQKFTYTGVSSVAAPDQGTVWPAAAKAPPPAPPAATVAQTVQAPRFEVDPLWPKPLPHHWQLGQNVGVSIDSHDHVFIIHRPATVNRKTEGGAAATPPIADCCTPAPPVLEFDPEGNLVNAWGGPGQGYDWPSSEHGISVDSKGNVWLGGNGQTDRQILKFTHDGHFLLQIGKPGAGSNSLSTTDFAGVAMMSFDEKANEAFVADGYRNKRIVVIDMTTGAIKRFWGAYGHKPDDADRTAYVPGGPPVQQFGNPVHCAMLSDDGLVYVADRKNDRIQVFHEDGSYIKEVVIAPETLGDGSLWEIAFSGDPAQKYMYVTDGKNERIYVLDRQSLAVLTTFGDGGRQPGEFFSVHSIATDSKGNIYTTETYEGRRIQKFTYKGIAAVPKDQGVVWPKR